MKRKRLGLLLVGGLMLLGGLMLTLSGCGRAEALDTLYEGEGPTVITYNEANAMLEEGKTFFFYGGQSFDIEGRSKKSKMLDRLFKEEGLNYYIVDRDSVIETPLIYERLFVPEYVIGIVHNREVERGKQSYVGVEGMTAEEVERQVKSDIETLLQTVSE